MSGGSGLAWANWQELAQAGAWMQVWKGLLQLGSLVP